jgi:flagellar motor switch protein FliN/FliY
MESGARIRIAGYTGEAFAAALNGLTGAAFQVALSDKSNPEKMDDALIWRQPFSLADGAVLWLIAGKNLWEAAGQMILGDSAGDEDCRSTWNEIAGQTMGGIAQALSREQGHDVLAKDGSQIGEVPGEGAQDATLEVRNGTQVWYVRVAWSGQFAKAYTEAPPVESSAEVKVEVPAAVQEASASRTLDLLLDVALPVSVSFGKTSLQIREVLKLNTGSVVELDRLVSEPVEVIVNNCVIARGEVVVVDGNYGVRVIHLASRAERLRSGMSEASTRLGTPAR